MSDENDDMIDIADADELARVFEAARRGVPFDELVDELAPYGRHKPAPLDLDEPQ